MGWHTITKENISESKINLNLEEDSYHGCYKVNVKFPEIFHFKDLGKRKFSSASLQKILNKEKGWRLTGKGSDIGLPTTQKGKQHEIPFLCLSKEDLEVSNLSAWYDAPPGSPPVVVIINLVDFL